MKLLITQCLLCTNYEIIDNPMVEHVLVYNIPYLWTCMVLQISYRWTYNFLFMVNCCFYVFDFAIVLTAKCQLDHYYLIAFFFFF